MSSIPAIPEFGASQAEMIAVIRALKDAVEQLGGLRQGESRGAPQMYVLPVRPKASRVAALRDGDLWINTRNDKLYYFINGNWREVL